MTADAEDELTEAQRVARAHREAGEARPALPTADEEQALYLRFLEKQREAAALRKQEAQRKDEQLTRDIEATVARSLGAAADDGTGRCQWCHIELGTDAEGHRTHIPTRSCPGPAPAACEICGGAWTWYGAPDFTWSHSCTRKARSHHQDVQLEKVHTPRYAQADNPDKPRPNLPALPAAQQPLEEDGADPFGVRGPPQGGQRGGGW